VPQFFPAAFRFSLFAVTMPTVAAVMALATVSRRVCP
jgi:hypothetical protein